MRARQFKDTDIVNSSVSLVGWCPSHDGIEFPLTYLLPSHIFLFVVLSHLQKDSGTFEIEINILASHVTILLFARFKVEC